MENWNNEKKLALLAEVRDTLCDAFTNANHRREGHYESQAGRNDAEKNVALIASALVKVLDKMDNLEEQKNPAQGARVIKRNAANNR